MYCCKQYMTVSGLGREGVSCGVCDESRTRVRSVSPARSSSPTTSKACPHRHRKPLLPSWVPKLLLPVSDKSSSHLASVVLVRVMQFPPSHLVRPLLANAAAWSRVAAATRENHYVAWGPGVLVNVHSSKLAEAMPLMDFTEHGG